MSLDQLQKIRERRMEKQLSELQAKREAMQQAEAQLAQAYQNLEQFHNQRLNQQESMFQTMLGQATSAQALQDYHSRLESLTAEEEQLRAAIPSAQQRVEEAKQQFLTAKKEANALAMKNEKTKEIVDIQSKNDNTAAQAQESMQD